MDGRIYLICWIVSVQVTVGMCQRFNVMTTTSSVAVTWNQSENFQVSIRSKNSIVCDVTRGQQPRICVKAGLEPSTRHDVRIISKVDNWTELYSEIHYTKPLAPRELKWSGSVREYISVQWKCPEHEYSVEGYITLLQRKSNNLTESQGMIWSKDSTIRHKIWLPSIYGVPYGTTFTLTLWAKYKKEKSSPITIDVYSAPRPVYKLWENTTLRDNTSAAVAWQRPESGRVTGYRLMIKSRMVSEGQFPVPGSQFRQKNITVSAEANSHVFYQLTPASSYQVSIWAIYYGAESSTDRYTTIYTTPSPVRRLTVSYWTTDTVTLSWLHDDPYLVVGFDYMITATANGHRKRQRVVSSAVNTQLRYLRPGYRYTLAISVKQATRPYGNSVAVTTNVQLKPDPVQYMEFNNITATSVNVSWHPGRYIQDHYDVRYHGMYLKKYWSTPVKSETTYIVLDHMFPGETYYVGVTAFSGDQAGMELTKTVTIVPLPPKSLHINQSDVADTSAVIQIKYDSSLSANTEWYVVYELWSTGRKSYLTVPVGVTGVALRRLIPGRMYTVRAYGRTSGGVQSTNSTDPVTFTTRPVFTSVIASSSTSRSLTVTYHYTSDTFDGYVFTLYPDVIKRFNMKYDEAEMTYHNLLPGTVYTIMVQVYWGEMFSEGKNITILTKPEVAVRCGETQNTSVDLMLDDTAGKVDEYVIQCNPGCTYSGTRITGLKTGINVHTIRDLNPDTSYEYKIRAIRFSGPKREESRERLIYCRTTSNDVS